MRKYYAFLLFNVIFYGFISSQNAVIKLTVKDAKTGESLPGANIFVDGNGFGSTDLDGHINLEVTKGQHKIKASYVGYEDNTKTLKIDSGEVRNLVITLEEIAKELSMVVVTGSRYEKDLSKETVSIDVISSQLIKNSNAVTTAEVLQKTPGVTITDGQASIRGGTGFSYGVGSRVNVLQDGVPILAGDQMNADWQFIPIENASQIEVYKGASSVLYGSGSLNGIINILTVWPTEKQTTTISPYVQVYGDPARKYAEWMEPFEQPFATGLFLSHTRKIKDNFDLVLGSNFHMERSYLQENDQFRVRVNAKTRYRPKKIPGLSFGVNSNIMYENSGRFFLWQDADTNSYRIGSGSDDKYYFFTVDPHLNYFDKKGNIFRVSGRYYRKFRYGNGEDINTVANISLLDFQYQRKFLKDMLTLTVGVTGTYGWNQSSIFVDSLQVDTTTGRPVKFFQSYSGAAFAQLEFNWRRWNLLIGTRYEMNGSDSFFVASLPVFRAGINFQASKTTFLRLAFGQSYRMPSLAERFVGAQVIPGINIFPNFNLQTETGWSAEIGVKQGLKITKHWLGYFDFSIFWMEFQEMVQYNLGLYSGQLGFKPDNVENARVAGFEATLVGKGKIGPIEIIPMIGYTYTYPANLEASPSQRDVGNFLTNMFTTMPQNLLTTPGDSLLLPFRNRHMFRTDLQLGYKDFDFGISMYYNSFVEKIDQNFAYIEVANPGFLLPYLEQRKDRNGDFTMDLRASYKFQKWNMKVSFVMKNVTNLEYAGRPGIMSAPRSFTLRWDFGF